MIINSENLNTLSDAANLGFVISLLGYSKKSYEINKESFNINKDMKILMNILNNIKIIMKKFVRYYLKY